MKDEILDSVFKNIFLKNKEFNLPIRWNGQDFLEFLKNLLYKYNSVVKKQFIAKDFSYNINNETKKLLGDLQKVIDCIINSVECYFNGFPSKAYAAFCPIMKTLQETSLIIYNKNTYEVFEGYDDKLNLFRAVKLSEYDSEEDIHKKTRVFHAPYNLRHRVSASRYSIAGFPSLYLGTSLNLCCKEINYRNKKSNVIASKFKLVREYDINQTDIKVIELGIKPQDFFREENCNIKYGRYFESDTLKSKRKDYIIWYPLIAACSFIRKHKKSSFVAEYIVPQLLMQWVREEMTKIDEGKSNKLVGIRYFSCFSEKASDMGFDYVFPVSGQSYSLEDNQYCPVLMKSFKMTTPYLLSDYESVDLCEKALIDDDKLYSLKKEL